MDISREKFDPALAELFAALDKPFNQVKSDAFWRGLKGMSFVQFCRARDQILRELEESEPPRTFNVHSLWAALKKQRAAAPEVTPVDNWRGDSWDECANRLLLGHIRKQASRGIHYCDDDTRMGKYSAKEPSPASRELTAPLVAWKNAWARDCRECEPAPTAAKQREWWISCMERAEVQINGVRAAQKAAA